MQEKLTQVWDWLSEDKRLGQLIRVILISYLLMLIFPQSLVAPHNAAPFSRWLAELQSTLGPSTKWLEALGLLSIRTSLWFRALLVFLVMVTLVRSINLLTQWGAMTKARRRWLSLICLSSLMFISGWSLHTLWGWAEADIIVWPQRAIILPEHDIVLPQTQVSFPLITSKFGLYLLPQGSNQALTVKVPDSHISSFMLSQAVHSIPTAVLNFAFTPRNPEAYFMIVDTDLIFRVIQAPEYARGALHLQVYRSASGEVLDALTFDAAYTFSMKDVQLNLEPAVLPRFKAIYNPGAFLQLVGGGLFMFSTWAHIFITKNKKGIAVCNGANVCNI